MHSCTLRNVTIDSSRENAVMEEINGRHRDSVVEEETSMPSTGVEQDLHPHINSWSTAWQPALSG